MFLEIFESLCAEKKVSPNKALADIGMSNAIYTNWKKRGSTPQGKNLQKIADYFGVSAGYLLGEKPDIHAPSIENPLIAEIVSLAELLARTESGLARLRAVAEDMKRAAELEQLTAELERARAENPPK